MAASPPCSYFAIDVTPPNLFVHPHRQYLLVSILLLSLAIIAPPLDPFVHP
jgi:hypothetical protein